MAKKLAFDRVLFTTVMVLVGLGVAIVYSASAVVAGEGGGRPYYYLYKQLVAVAVGLAAMGVAMHVDYRNLARRWLVWGLVGGVIGMQAVVLVSPTLNSARRWLIVGGLSFQPSELAKVAIVVFLAYQIAKRPPERRGMHLVVPVALVVGPMAAMVLVGRDLAGASLLAAAAGLMLFLSGLSWLHLGLGALGLAPVVLSAILAVPYRRERVMAFLRPESVDPLAAGFQPAQSLIALGSGGLFGVGLGKSLQKLYFLPYPHSDYVFAIVGEELGLVGALGVLAAFGVLAWRGVRAGFRAPDEHGRYLAWGLTGMILVQALIHVSVSVGIFPATGVTLPFISYGGSSLAVSLLAVGVVLNVSQHG
ncbi:MAG: putative peptidoglycan glycosyltransferase FtsW [Thermoanaerobaculia bacterium]|nr:putative peptidoglycan glycosyltransferase FtsW [Thermoanaerobaculia bacterium]